MESVSIKVVDARDPNKVIMVYVEPIELTMTVQDFKQKLCKESDTLSKLYVQVLIMLHRKAQSWSDKGQVDCRNRERGSTC